MICIEELGTNYVDSTLNPFKPNLPDTFEGLGKKFPNLYPSTLH
jgi:hypothetical protein